MARWNKSNNAMQLTQVCYNLAILSPERRLEALREFQLSMQMVDADFAEFQQDVVDPMIRRCDAAIPNVLSAVQRRFDFLPSSEWEESDDDKLPKPTTLDRYSPCACGSGKKFKFCRGCRVRK
jgi:hypothetical protein